MKARRLLLYVFLALPLLPTLEVSSFAATGKRLPCILKALNETDENAHPLWKESLARLPSDQVHAELDRIVSSHLARDPEFPAKEYREFMDQEFSRHDFAKDEPLGAWLKTASERFVTQAEASRDVARKDLIGLVDGAEDLAKKEVAACKEQPCTEAEVDKLGSKLAQYFDLKKSCLANSPAAIKTLKRTLALFYGGLLLQHAHKTSSKDWDPKKSAAENVKNSAYEFNYDVAANYTLWFTILGEVGCRRQLGTVTNPVKPVETPKFKDEYKRYVLGNYKNYYYWAPAIATTQILFNKTQDTLKDKERPPNYYTNRWVGLTLYEAAVGTLFRLHLDFAYLRKFPGFEKRWLEYFGEGGKSVASWNAVDWGVRQSAATTKSEMYFGYLDTWGKHIKGPLEKAEAGYDLDHLTLMGLKGNPLKVKLEPVPDVTVPPAPTPTPTTRTEALKDVADQIANIENRIKEDRTHENK